MNTPRWLASPLAGTAAVLAGLGLLAIPLRQLTSATPPAPAAPTLDPTETHAVLRLRTLTPARRLVVKTPTGTILLDARDLPAGESEHDVRVVFDHGGLELTVVGEFELSGTETAVFLTVMPDQDEDQTRYAIGTGHLEETLRYEWRHR